MIPLVLTSVDPHRVEDEWTVVWGFLEAWKAVTVYTTPGEESLSIAELQDGGAKLAVEAVPLLVVIRGNDGNFYGFLERAMAFVKSSCNENNTPLFVHGLTDSALARIKKELNMEGYKSFNDQLDSMGFRYSLGQIDNPIGQKIKAIAAEVKAVRGVTTGSPGRLKQLIDALAPGVAEALSKDNRNLDLNTSRLKSCLGALSTAGPTGVDPHGTPEAPSDITGLVTVIKHDGCGLFVAMDIDYQMIAELDREGREAYARQILASRQPCQYVQRLADLYFLIAQNAQPLTVGSYNVTARLKREALPRGSCLLELIRGSGVSENDEVVGALRAHAGLTKDWRPNLKSKIFKFLQGLDQATDVAAFLKAFDEGRKKIRFDEWLQELDDIFHQLRSRMNKKRPHEAPRDR